MLRKLIPSLFLIVLSSYFFFNLFKNSNVFFIKNCSELNYEESQFLHPNKFSNLDIELIFDSEKKWKKIQFNNLLNSKENLKLFEKKNFYFKKINFSDKKAEAKIIVNLNNVLACKIKAEIAAHGILSDHWDGSYILPSLNVSLKDGHIHGITKFILFRPVTRSWDNEIIGATISKSLGLVAPRTTSAKVKYNNNFLKFIFQERIVKEFLEINKIKEGPVLEGNTLSSMLLTKKIENNVRNIYFAHQVTNENWSSIKKENLNISKRAISILNKFSTNYIENSKSNRILPADYYAFEKKFYASKYFQSTEIFNAFIYSIRGIHGLTIDDRKYYYDSLNNNFIPIYWDIAPKILDKNNQLINELPEIEKNLFNTITSSGKTGAAKVLKLFDNIDEDKLFKIIKDHNVDLTHSNYVKMIENIKLELKKNSLKEESKIENLVKKNIIDIYGKQNIKDLLPNYLKINFIHEVNNSEYLLCKNYYDHCEKISLSDKKISKSLSSIYEKKNNIISTNVYSGKILEDNRFEWFYEFFNKKNSMFEIELGKQKIFINGNIDYKIDLLNKKIFFNKKSNYGNVIFKNSDLENWNIVFNNTNKEEYVGNDEYNLTGCINFYDMNLKDISIEVNDSNCEDAVNFVRSNGTIKNLYIKNAKTDSIDADFSKLKFQNIYVKKSGNDCVDFSYGQYYINSATLENCGDKGVSNGELSETKVNEIDIINTNIGIASKDFAKIILNKTSIKDVNICYSAYKKKQEFSGGYLEVINSNCINNKKENFSDIASVLNIKNL